MAKRKGTLVATVTRLGERCDTDDDKDDDVVGADALFEPLRSDSKTEQL